MYLPPNTSNFGYLNFPMGTGGNHVRWLLFLDSKFTPLICENTLDSKVEFIKKNVYTSDRTWYNWLKIEWKYRTLLDSILAITHGFDASTTSKQLCLVVNNPQPSLEHYLSINIGLNGQKITDLEQRAHWWREEMSRKDLPSNLKVVVIDDLLEPILSKSLYQELIDFYQFDDNYDVAKDIHTMYYECRLNSLHNFYKHISRSDTRKYLHMIKNRVKGGHSLSKRKQNGNST